MAIDSATTLESGFSQWLTPEDSAPIFEDARRQSVVQQLVPQVPLAYNGRRIPVVTDEPSAEWVGEGQQKPTTSAGMDMKYMEPHKLASIAVVSQEVVRANPANYMQIIRDGLANAFAKAFDAAALHSTNSPFATSVGQTTKTQNLGDDTMMGDLNGALRQLVVDDHKLTGWAFDSVAEPLLNAASDSMGRPLLIDPSYSDANVTVSNARLLGRPAFVGKGVAGPGDVVGFAGDWNKARWGVVGGISYDISKETAVTIGGELRSLWEYNLVAIRAEMEAGFVVGDTDAFVKLTNTTAATEPAA